MRLITLAILLCSTLYAETTKEFIYETAPFRSAHASTVVELRNGDLMASWFGGTAEGQPDVAIWGSRRSNGVWSVPVELVREPDIASYNPVLFYTKDNVLWLYYKFGPHPDNWTGGRKWSKDDGATWTEVEHLPAGLYGPIRAKPYVAPDGTIVSGTSVESYRSWACWIERSTDNGKTWTKSGPITVAARTGLIQGGDAPAAVPGASEWIRTDGVIQPSVISLGGRHLRIYARSTVRTGKICIADSKDGGITWTQARPIDVPNPNSGIDAVGLRDGRVVLIYNNSDHARTPLNLAVSADGEHFRMFQTLEDEPGEYSYPAMVQAKNGDLLITYTWKRSRIRFMRVALADIPK